MTLHTSTISIAASLILALGMLSGCSGGDSSYYGKVTAINGNELTIELGTMPDRDNQAPDNKGEKPPEMPEQSQESDKEEKASDSDTKEKKADEPASDTNADKQELPKNRGRGRGPKEGFGFASTGETKTVTLADSTKITRQGRDQEETASADDITIGTIVKVTGNKAASSIVIQGGMRNPDNREHPQSPDQQDNSENEQSSSSEV